MIPRSPLFLWMCMCVCVTNASTRALNDTGEANITFPDWAGQVSGMIPPGLEFELVKLPDGIQREDFAFGYLHNMIQLYLLGPETIPADRTQLFDPVFKQTLTALVLNKEQRASCHDFMAAFYYSFAKSIQELTPNFEIIRLYRLTQAGRISIGGLTTRPRGRSPDTSTSSPISDSDNSTLSIQKTISDASSAITLNTSAVEAAEPDSVRYDFYYYPYPGASLLDATMVYWILVNTMLNLANLRITQVVGEIVLSMGGKSPYEVILRTSSRAAVPMTTDEAAILIDWLAAQMYSGGRLKESCTQILRMSDKTPIGNLIIVLGKKASSLAEPPSNMTDLGEGVLSSTRSASVAVS